MIRLRKTMNNSDYAVQLMALLGCDVSEVADILYALQQSGDEAEFIDRIVFECEPDPNKIIEGLKQIGIYRFEDGR